MHFTEQDLRDLKTAKQLLESPGMAVKIANLIGLPIEKGFALLPGDWHAKIGELTRAALTKAVHAAVFTLKDAPHEEPSPLWHKAAVAATGGIGGFFGLPALALELPISTTIMVRSIADIARSQGESVEDTGCKMACIEVFSLGGHGRSDDAAESGYFAVRAALAQTISRAAEFIAAKGVADEGAPVLVRLIVQIAERFSMQVSQKAAAQAIPALGAAGGALVNTLFIDHFQDMARGHFTVRRLERTCDRDLVQAAYQDIEL